MAKYKIKRFFNSFRNKLVIIIALIAVTSILLLTKFFLKNENPEQDNYKNTEEIIYGENPVKPNMVVLENTLDPGIDSVLANFGIKKEWVITVHNVKKQKPDSKTALKDAEWFTKTVMIPRDLSSIEINVDLSSYINSAGLSSNVNENIITKDITIIINNPDTVKSKLLLAKIFVNHSDKITRESGIFCLILNNIGEYKQEETDRLLLDKSEFSFVFPRNLDEIDTQNKLLHNKKDVLINLTVGGKDDYESDFNVNLDEKGVRERVKTFSSDFPTVSKVILTGTEPDLPQLVINLITEELNKFKINVISDSALTKLLGKTDEDSKDKIGVIVNNLKSKAGLSKNIIAIITIEPGEFERFYEEVLLLKKLGYKFYNFTEYLAKKTETQKQEQLKEEKLQKLKQEQDLKKKSPDKKSTGITKPKQTDKKHQKPKTSTNDKKKK